MHSNVTISLGGAHGFDGNSDWDSRFFNNVAHHCQQDIGMERVLRVGFTNTTHRQGGQKLTTLSVAAFFTTEWHSGGLHHAIKGFE